MSLAPLCVLLLGYLCLCYIGTLLMRLVLVQVVEAPIARYGFATAFATSVSLFLLVLADAIALGGAAPSDTNLPAPREGAAVPTGLTGGLGDGLLAVPQRVLYALLHDSTGVMAHEGRYAGEDTVVFAFRALLGLLLFQVLVASPTILTCLVVAKRMSTRRRRQEQARQVQAAARQLEDLDGDPFGRRTRKARSRLSRCCPSSIGSVVICLLLVTIVCGIVTLVFLRVTETALSVVPFARSLLRAAAGMVLRGAAAVLSWFTMPPEVPAQNVQQQQQPAQTAVADPAAVAAAIAAEALAHVTSPVLRLLYYVTEVLTANVATVGVAIVGLLGGYAAVTTPYNYLVSYFYYRKKEEVLVQAQQQLSKKQRYALTLCATKMRRLAQESHESRTRLAPGQEDFLFDKVSAQNELENRSTTAAGRRGGWLGGLLNKTKAAVASAASSTKARLGSVAGGRRTSARDRQQLRVEAEHARNLSLFLYLKMDEVGYMLKEARRGNTWVGQFFATCGLLLGLYSVVKFILTVASLYLFRVSTQDPVTRAVSLLEHYWVLPRQRQQGGTLGGAAMEGGGDFSFTAIQMSTQLIVRLALVVNAWMIATSIRGLLLTIFQLTLSFTTVVTADTTAVAFAMLMAAYFMGQLVLLRQSLPAPSMARMPGGAAATEGGDGGGSFLSAAVSASADALASSATTAAAAAANAGFQAPRGAEALALSDSYASSLQVQQTQAIAAALGEGTAAASANVLFVVLGSLPLYFYQRLNDWCFVVGCVVTVIARRWVLGDPSKATVSIANG